MRYSYDILSIDSPVMYLDGSSIKLDKSRMEVLLHLFTTAGLQQDTVHGNGP